MRTKPAPKTVYSVRSVSLLFNGNYQTFRIRENGVFSITYEKIGIWNRCTVLYTDSEMIEVSSIFPWQVKVLEWEI